MCTFNDSFRFYVSQIIFLPLYAPGSSLDHVQIIFSFAGASLLCLDVYAIKALSEIIPKHTELFESKSAGVMMNPKGDYTKSDFNFWTRFLYASLFLNTTRLLANLHLLIRIINMFFLVSTYFLTFFLLV